MNITFYLRDLDETLVAAWEKYFADCPEVKPSSGDIFEIKADVLVSPANSFGFMDGGIDRIYSQKIGWHLQEHLQTLLREKFDGELPIGMAVALPTDNADYPCLISAPTMRAPTDVSQTLNAYLAFRAVLRLVNRMNLENPNSITSVLCPGLATATGNMKPEICAKQMYTAYREVTTGNDIPPGNINEAILEHYRLLRVDD